MDLSKIKARIQLHLCFVGKILRASILMGEIPAKSDVEVRETERESRAGDVRRARSQPVERLACAAIGWLLSATLNRSRARHHRMVHWHSPSRQRAETTSHALIHGLSKNKDTDT